jgi:D-arginine dehydrogenase
LEAFDIIIIGAGMAGASVARELSGQARVLLLEREQQPGYHSTGRSAAAFIPSYGADNPALRLLTNHSLDVMLEPPAELGCGELLRRRGLLTLCTPDDASELEREYARHLAAVPSLLLADSDFIRMQVPLVTDDYAQGGWFEQDVYDIDVHALHEGYLRDLRRRGGQTVNAVDIQNISREKDLWHIATADATYCAPVLVNAAGAWADQIAALAGVQTIGLAPLRRTAVLLDPPAGCDVSAWPVVMASDGSFYFKPDAGLILVSPADEHPSAPCDAQPEELDIAYAVHFAQQALQLEVRQVKHSWAGLRNFAPDRTPVIGFAADSEGFFWLAGQGGHGIQTAPAAAKLAASLLLQRGLPADLEDAGFDLGWVSPLRLAGN